MAASLVKLHRTSFKIVSILSVAFILSSCAAAKNQIQFDRSAEMSTQDYRDLMAPNTLPAEADANIPDFQAVLSTPQELRLPSPLVTVSVNQTVGLRDLLFELAEQADIDLEMDPQIRGSIIFTAKDRPFDQVIDRICVMAGLRYTFKENVLRVELDRPYVKNYTVDYINAARSSTSNINTEISLSTAGGDTGAEGGGGSKSTISTEVGGDLWAELAANLEQILSSSDTHISLATLADPISNPINPTPARISNDPNNPTPPPLPGSPEVAPMPAAVAPTLNISAGQAEPYVPNSPATYSISRQAGFVSVFANERQHKLVATFLDNFRKRTTTQVLIEAKVLQVDLTDEFAAGINWNILDASNSFNMSGTFTEPAMIPPAGGVFTGIFSRGDFGAAVSMISRFGAVRALSSPRVTVINNQAAVVNVAQNNVYFNFDVETEDDSDTNTQSVNISSEQLSVPEGVLLNVVPTANPDTGEIQLVVRPTVSKITRFVTDPTIALSLASLGIDPANANVPDNQVPEVSVQEIDSILRLQSGQMMVMGGLMKDANTVTEVGVPVLSEIPLLGSMFKNHVDSIEKSELVILIKATIIPGSGNADDMDRKFYKNVSLDRRPSRL